MTRAERARAKREKRINLFNMLVGVGAVVGWYVISLGIWGMIEKLF